MELVLQVLVGGLLMGGVYCLISIGLSLTFGVMKIMNFAHGEFLMLGMYAVYFAFYYLGIDPYIIALLLTPAMFGIGILAYHFIVRPIVNKHDNYQMLYMIGLQFFIQNLALAVFSPNPRIVEAAVSAYSFRLGSVFIDAAKLAAAVVSIIATLAFFYIMQRTDLGRSIRAAAQDREAASAHGVNVDRVYHLAYGIGTACVAIAAALLSPIFQIEPTISSYFTTPCFVAVVLGGLGSFAGAAVGAYIVGLGMEVGNLLLGGSLGPALPLVIFILVLIFKPEGLWGVKER